MKDTLTRIYLLIICHFLLFLTPSLVGATSVVLTIDDGPWLEATPMLSAETRNQRLLDAFKAKNVHVVLFANGIHGGDTTDGHRWLEIWGKAGHRIANHTYSHPNLNEVSFESFQDDFLKLDAMIRPIPGYWPMLRFPYQVEGKDSLERKRVQAMLKQFGYKSAPVSIPTYDWVFNGRLHDLLKANPGANIISLKTLYLQHIAAVMDGYRELARELLGRDPIHTILLHHNLLNALVMPDLLRTLEANGWQVVSPEAGYTDPLYTEDVTDMDTSESILISIARKKNILLLKSKILEGQFEKQKRILKEYVP